VRRSTLILCAGGAIIVAGAVLLVRPLVDAYRWQTSPIAAQAERNAAAPLVVTPRATSTLIARPTALPTAPARTAPTAAPTSKLAIDVTTQIRASTATPVPTEPPLPVPAVPPTPTLGPSDLKLGEAAFEFLDPPQPGATARLSVIIRNPTLAPSGPVSLDLPLAWLNGYSIEGVVPLPVDGTLNGERVTNSLRLTVDGPPAGEELELSVFVVTTDEVIDAPNLRLIDAEGREIGRAHPRTEAPVAAPGPVYALDIPGLRLHAGVVQVDWEPPLFVVGQLRDSAYVSRGNSVLVGHVHGAAGYNVFSNLDRLAVGDEVVANSRGTDYRFIVTETEVLPADDASPTLPTDTPRLTLMTCTGDFNPLTGEYADRLWVIAEPVDAPQLP
jgi:LPXTG-site transpeptidase (sortase) family protein